MRDDPPAGSPTSGLPGLDTILSAAGALGSLGPLLDNHTIREPLHVTLRDLGFKDPAATPRILVLETLAVQIDAGLNEIPQGTCSLAVGRAAYSPDIGTPSLVGGADDASAASIVHVLEKYLTRFVPAKIYGFAKTTASAGVGDLGDNRDWPDEPFVLFDGFTAGPTRRGSAESSQFVLHITHFLAGLSFSSSLSGQVAAGAISPVAFSIARFMPSGTGDGSPITPFGAVASCMAGGLQIYSDFWGWQVPSDGVAPQQACVKGFLNNLAKQDTFNWQLFKTGDFSGTICAGQAGDALKNNQALPALSRIEPIWPDWGEVAPEIGGNAAANSVWGSIAAAMTAAKAARGLAAVDRNDMITRAGEALAIAGYRYGVPFGLYIDRAMPISFIADPSRGFASDIVGATFGDLAPASFWELIAARYSSRYQIAIAPMADRAVVIPAAPILDAYWQFVYASEIFSWNDDVQVPSPIRGVLFTVDRPAPDGATNSNYSHIEAGFDSCQPGVFITREMPAWLVTYYSASGVTAATIQGTKAMASAPWTTAPAALADVGGADVVSVIGNPKDATIQYVQSTANRLAKAMWQQERLRYRSLYISGRFRIDIGPGSLLTIELPADRYVRKGLGDNRDVIMKGMVLRMTHTIDCEGEHASTSFQLGFVRLEGETLPGQPLFSQIHPIWTSATLGIPWCDTQAMRDLLDDRANIIDQLQGP